ncbi:hypothetical protein EK21DRAFT_93497 [Setomelanomma holmii]|uniref:C2H2-type domain-containing protein n=1 Tax=Setomelanomma holmii TaxID=210430 RepID=A0A9P4LIJ0_9PLEO|nr:hypothetical protein EK21DRAFT_93497 [Setomelanomma holmii]
MLGQFGLSEASRSAANAVLRDACQCKVSNKTNGQKPGWPTSIYGTLVLAHRPFRRPLWKIVWQRITTYAMSSPTCSSYCISLLKYAGNSANISGSRQDELHGKLQTHPGNEHTLAGDRDAPKFTREELTTALQTTDSVLSDLARMSAMIRVGGLQSRHSKADKSFDPDDEDHRDFHDHLILIVLGHAGLMAQQQGRVRDEQKHDIPESTTSDLTIGPENSSWIKHDTTMKAKDLEDRLTMVQRRLILANLRRRHRFTYSWLHAKKMVRFRPAPPTIAVPALDLVPVSTINYGDVEAEVSISHEESIEMPLETQESETVAGLSDTTATALATETAQDLAKISTPSQQAVTEISMTGARVKYPRPPKMRPGAQVFKCPCCSLTLPVSFSEARRWRKHVHESIVPYTCILTDCPDPVTLYSDKDSWLQHIFQDHHSEPFWECMFCNSATTFQTGDELGAHITRQHDRAVSHDDLDDLLSVCYRRTSPTLNTCPLCTVDPGSVLFIDADALLEHVAEHIHGFAMRSLPWAPDSIEHNRQTIALAFEKVEQWFEKSYPGAQGVEYQPSLNEGGGTNASPGQVPFSAFEYFAESSGASVLTVSQQAGDSESDDSASNSSWKTTRSGSVASPVSDHPLNRRLPDSVGTGGDELPEAHPSSPRPWYKKVFDNELVLGENIGSHTGLPKTYAYRRDGLVEQVIPGDNIKMDILENMLDYWFGRGNYERIRPVGQQIILTIPERLTAEQQALVHEVRALQETKNLFREIRGASANPPRRPSPPPPKIEIPTSRTRPKTKPIDLKRQVITIPHENVGALEHMLHELFTDPEHTGHWFARIEGDRAVLWVPHKLSEVRLLYVSFLCLLY